MSVGRSPHLFVFLFAGVLPLQAQDPPKPPSSPQRAAHGIAVKKLNSKFEAWYTITEFDRHLGSAQLYIDPYGSGDVRDISYKQHLIFDVLAKEKGMLGYRVEKRLEALLSSSYEIKNFELRFRFLGRHHVARLVPGRQQVEIEVVGEGVRETVSLADKPNPYLNPELGILILTQKGLLASKDLHDMSLVVADGDQLKLVTVRLKVAGEETRRYMNHLQKAIRLTVDNPPPNYNVSDFWVDQTGRILEYVTRSHVRFQIARESQFTRIEGKVDTWYVGAMLIAQRETQVGYGRSTIDPKEVSIDYRWEHERRVGILDSVMRENVSVTAQLDKKFKMLSGRYDWKFSHMWRQAVFDGRDQRLEYRDSLGQTKTLRLSLEDKFYFTIDQALVSLAQSEELLRAGIHDVVLMDPENQEVARIQLTVRGVVRRDYLGLEVIALQVQGIGKEDRAWDIYVDRYGRPLEISENPGVRFIVVAGEKEAKGVLTAPLPPSGIVDPIQSKLTFKGADDRTAPRTFEKRRQDLEASYIEVRKTEERIRALIDAEQRIIAKRIVPEFRGMIEKFRRALEAVQEFKDDLDRDPQIRVWADQVTVWERRIEEEFPVWETYMEELRVLHRQLIDELTRGDAAAVRATIQRIEGLKGRHEDFPEDVREQARQMIDQARKLFRDFEARRKMEAMDFDINAIAWERKTVIHPIRIQVDLFGAGIDRTEPVRVTLTRAYAVIDGRVYSEGDRLTKEGIELSISRIEKDKVSFTFGDLSKDVLLRR